MSMEASNLVRLPGELYRGGDGVTAQSGHAGMSAPVAMSSVSGIPDASASGGFATAGAIGGGQSGRRPRPLGGRVKRLADIVIAATALVLVAPLMLVVAILLMARNGSPVIFAHERIGFDGKPFRCYKFRTMVGDADGRLQAYLADNPEAACEWHETRKLKHDPRVTLLGRMLRVSSLDELPQLFNVLRGDMSCVGPRPVVMDELQRYGEKAADYLSTRPGVTGLWQVSGRSSVDYAQRIGLDSHYVNNWSIGYDVLILLRTIIAVTRVDRAS